jgi:hypothetical protein
MSICLDSTYSTQTLNSLKTSLTASAYSQIVNSYGIELSIYIDQIKAFNYLLGYNNATNYMYNNSPNDSEFDKNFMFQMWKNESYVNLLSEMILSLDGVGTTSLGGNYAYSQVNIYGFWNAYLDFVFYQFFCTDTGLARTSKLVLATTETSLLQLQNLKNLLLTSENGGFGTGGSGTKRICEFCTSFWGSDVNKIRSNLSTNPLLNNFCGCCTGMPVIGMPNGVVDPLLRCQPMCSSNDVIKSYAGSSDLVNNGGDNSYTKVGGDFYSIGNNGHFSPYSCPNQTICIMDKINIKIASTNGSLNFNQVCPGCAGGGCQCFIDSGSTVLDKIASGNTGLSDPVQFNQDCGGGALCFNINSDGSRTQVKCNTNNVSNTSKNLDLNNDNSGDLNYLTSYNLTNVYTYGVGNLLVPLIFMAIVVIYLLLTSIDMVSHIKRTYKMVRMI